MNRKPSTIEKIARIMIALTIVLAGFVGVFLNAPAAYADNVEPVSVVSSTDVTNPNNILVDNLVNCSNSAYYAVLNNPSEIVVDWGTSNLVDSVTVGGINDAGTTEVFISNDNSSWTDLGPFTRGTCDQQLFSFSATMYRYLKLTTDSSSASRIDTVLMNFATTPAPTVSPTPPYATPFPPQPTACVTAMPTGTATRQASPTPLIQRTPTPGGATATPGPSATGTPLPSFDSGIAAFAQSLQPWTATEHFSFGGLYVTEWRSDVGPDGQPGVAFEKDYAGLLDNPAGPLTTTEPLSGSLTFSRPGGMFFPFRVTGSVKWSASILGGESAYLRVWYFDPDYVSAGHGAWVTDPPNWRDQFSSDWSHFSFVLSQHGGSGRVTAVAISEELDGTERSGEGALLDNLRVYSGPQAVAGSFPTCQGSGGVGSSPIQTKVCIIKQINVDVYADCAAPTSLIDVVGWLAYLYCRLAIYFKFLPENRQQLSDLQARQNLDEPFGTFIEANEAIGVFGDIWQDVSNINNSNAAAYRRIEWSTLWNFRQLDDISTLLHIPTADPSVLQQYRNRCPTFSEDGMNTKLFRDYGCLVVVFARDQVPLFGAWQWVIDLSSLGGLVIYAIYFLKSHR
jgi:hypothetical protein